MRFFQLTHIGAFHTDHNEDFMVVEDVGENRTLIAVMDGCSSGTDSHFASTMIGKLLRKIAKQEAYREYIQKKTIDLSQLLEQVSLQLFEELSNLNRQLDLRSDEILSTLLLGLVDRIDIQAELLIVGDGIIHVDGQNYEYENDNKPDYIGYHLSKDKNDWYRNNTQKKSIENFKDLSIATDGIHTFKNHDGVSYEAIDSTQIMEAFFEDTSNLDNENKLKKSLLKIKKENGLMPSDDLTIIRVMSQE